MQVVPALADALRAARSAVALCGAGMSTASGLPDYRSQTGLWGRNDWTEVATLTAFRRDPDVVWEFYRTRLAALGAAHPNPAHEALAALEHAGLLTAVVTQNVDGLHQKAGSERVVQVHGDLTQAVCLSCGAREPRERVEAALAATPGAPRCSCGAPLKPGVVLFGETLPEDALSDALALAGECDLMLCLGSSLEVHPVAALPGVALDAGARLAVLTEGPTPYDAEADLRSYAPLAEVLPALAAAVGAGGPR
jgi:NAD-dependent deacetylase